MPTSDRRPRSLSARLVVGSALLALVVAAAFGVLVFAVTTLDDATKRERHTKAVTAETLRLERLVLDLDTGLRGFVLTGKGDLLAPWTSARAALPKSLRDFQQLASTTAGERRRAVPPQRDKHSSARKEHNSSPPSATISPTSSRLRALSRPPGRRPRSADPTRRSQPLSPA